MLLFTAQDIESFKKTLIDARVKSPAIEKVM